MTNEIEILFKIDALDGSSSDVEYNRAALAYLSKLQSCGYY